MPHFVIEVAKPLLTPETVKNIIGNVKQAAIQSELFTPDDIKCRLQPYQYYDCGQYGLQFIHVVAKILKGRSLEQKQRLSFAVLEHLKQLSLDNTSLTVEVVDIERESYAKKVTLSQ